MLGRLGEDARHRFPCGEQDRRLSQILCKSLIYDVEEEISCGLIKMCTDRAQGGSGGLVEGCEPQEAEEDTGFSIRKGINLGKMCTKPGNTTLKSADQRDPGLVTSAGGKSF